MGLVVREDVPPQVHSGFAYLLDGFHLGVVKICPPVEWCRFRVTISTRDTANIILGMRVEELDHFWMQIQTKKIEQLLDHFVRLQ